MLRVLIKYKVTLLLLFAVAFLFYRRQKLITKLECWYNRPELKILKNVTFAYTHESDSFKNSFTFDDNDDVAYEIINDTSILPPSARIVPKKIFRDKPLVIWATEWHMTPIKDIKNLLEPFGVTVLDYNLDIWRCDWHDCTFKDKLKVLDSYNVLEVPPPIAEKFYAAYKDDPEMKSVDIVLCSYPASICEIYIPLNKSVLVLPTTRYDVGRYTEERWNKLNENLRILAQKPWNVFGGNNLYDAKYLQYYTGIKTQHLPSACDYTGAEYTNEINEFLIVRRRDKGFNDIFFEEFEKFCCKINCEVKLKMLENMPHTFKDLAKYRGIVHVPYQISVMSIFEQYRMNIPMFFPSPELLARWQVDHYLMPERSFNGAFFGERPKASIIPAHPSQTNVPDPKNEYDYESILYWMRFADFYQIMPHCFIYESIGQLVDILTNVVNETLQQASNNMRAYNIEFKKKIIHKWKEILLNYSNSH